MRYSAGYVNVVDHGISCFFVRNLLPPPMPSSAYARIEVGHSTLRRANIEKIRMEIIQDTVQLDISYRVDDWVGNGPETVADRYEIHMQARIDTVYMEAVVAEGKKRISRLSFL